MAYAKTVDAYFETHTEWAAALTELRALILGTGMPETLKWGAPAYTVKGKNVVGLCAFQSYCGLWFFQGALLKDEAGKLVNAQEGVTHAMRQWRFQSVEEIRAEAALIKAYLQEAMLNQEQGKVVPVAKRKTVAIPTELQEKLDQNAAFKTAYDGFTPGKQREFAAYIGEAKRAETRIRRLEKVADLVLRGVGLNDQYR